jgi:hypothetical protein
MIQMCNSLWRYMPLLGAEGFPSPQLILSREECCSPQTVQSTESAGLSIFHSALYLSPFNPTRPEQLHHCALNHVASANGETHLGRP